MQHRHALGNLAHECHIVLDDQNRHALGVERLDEFARPERFLRRHAGRRLVQKKKLRSASAIPISSHCCCPCERVPASLPLSAARLRSVSSRSSSTMRLASEKRFCSAIWIFCRTGNSLKTLGACILMLMPRCTRAKGRSSVISTESNRIVPLVGG